MFVMRFKAISDIRFSDCTNPTCVSTKLSFFCWIIDYFSLYISSLGIKKIKIKLKISSCSRGISVSSHPYLFSLRESMVLPREVYLGMSAQFLFSTRTHTHLSLALRVCSVSVQHARTHTHTHISLSLRICSVSVQQAHTHTSLSLSASAQFLFSRRTHTHLSLSLHLLSFCSVRGREEQSLIQLNTDISCLLL